MFILPEIPEIILFCPGIKFKYLGSRKGVGGGWVQVLIMNGPNLMLKLDKYLCE